MWLREALKKNPGQIRDVHVDLIIRFAGDGKLGDNNAASAEFRSFLSEVSPEMLERYGDECLTKPFRDSGLALQDIVNEIAARLGFKVEPGRYRGTKSAIGQDGIWSADGHSLVVEVKTTDAYRLPIETLVGYRRALVKSDQIQEDHSSILIVVGREDTGGLEAQIRGSRHAWDVNLISVDALVRLMKIEQELEDPRAKERMRSLLIPRDYTQMDEIVDLVYAALPQAETVEAPNDVSFIDRVAGHLGANLTKQSGITYTDTNAGIAVTCSVSKEYPDPKGARYSFAFHRHHLQSLKAAQRGYAAFGCGSTDRIALFPVEAIEGYLDGMNQTQDKQRSYWPVHIHWEREHWVVRGRDGEDWPDITARMLFGTKREGQPGSPRG